MMSPDLNERYHRELANLQEWIDADETAIADAKLEMKILEKRVKALTKNVEKRREGWNRIYRAYIRRDLELPPHQPILFEPDPIAAEEAAAEASPPREQDDDQVDVASDRGADEEEAIKDAAARFYRPPSKADERPVRPAKGSKRGASPAAVGAAASAQP